VLWRHFAQCCYIATILKRRILSGRYPPHSRIPTESELAETYEVARTTARRAVGALRDEGLVYTVPPTGYLRRSSRATASGHEKMLVCGQLAPGSRPSFLQSCGHRGSRLLAMCSLPAYGVS
jgi:DNA-binding FadR family transcriptional regulator